MNEFINMTCPSCGGQLQAQKNMQKIFCMHCGTELLLKQDNEGVLITIKARDLQASAKLKEMQLSASVLEMLKTQIYELEVQVKQIRNYLLIFCNPGSYNKYYSKFEKEQNLAVHLQDYFNRVIYDKNYNKGPDWEIYLIDHTFPGFTSEEELLKFLQFLEQPEYKNKKDAKQMISILEPLPAIAEDLKVKKAQLKNMLEQAINNQ